MTAVPTPEEFLHLDQPEDDSEDYTPAPGVGSDPLASIATSLEALTGLVSRLDREAAETDQLRAELTEARLHAEEFEAHLAAAQEQLDQVLEICGKSTSKLANSIRAVLTPDPSPAPDGQASEAVDDAAPEPGSSAQDVRPSAGEVSDPVVLVQPAHDAGVEEWREYARGLGYTDVDNANRSQIRTLLGIPQPVSAS